MTNNDLIGSVGVAIILLAYFLNTSRLLPKDGKAYYVLNIIGAAIATYASYLIGFIPFVILEGTWTLVSIYGLMKAMRIRMT